MAYAALALLLAGVAVMAVTGWPSHAVLLAVACAIAATGVATGAIEPALLQALPARVVGILEHDLLQAVALFAFVSALLRRSDVAPRTMATFEWLLSALRVPPGPRAAIAGHALAVVSAPLNGSVGAGVDLQSSTTLPHWRAAGVTAPRAVAFAAAGASFGVLVPPSLVLILLGDAMLRAHTEGLQLGGIGGVRVINTQDLVQACVLPALLLALAWAVLIGWRSRGAAGAGAPPRVTLAGIVAPAAVVGLLAAVGVGRLRAVEAAATAALALFAHAALTGRLGAGRLGEVLDDAMATTGALFALLLAATTLGLLLRAAGCDRLAMQAIGGFAGRPMQATATVLAMLLALALVLDAFELIFLVVPIVMPPLLALGVDAAWVACLALIVLQVGFLLPPMGYALALTRARVAPPVPAAALAREVAPFVTVLALLFATVWLVPGVTQWLRSAPAQLEAPVPAQEAEELLRQMGSGREPAR